MKTEFKMSMDVSGLDFGDDYEEAVMEKLETALEEAVRVFIVGVQHEGVMHRISNISVSVNG